MSLSKILAIVFLFIVAKSCDEKADKNLTQQQESEMLNELLTEIQNLASSKECIDALAWTYTAYGSKACGGPVGYIAYSTNIDTDLLLDKVEEHKTAQQEYNQKWSIFSDCSVPPEPDGVICENGSPVFVY
jgi:hypothetical protein